MEISRENMSSKLGFIWGDFWMAKVAIQSIHPVEIFREFSVLNSIPFCSYMPFETLQFTNNDVLFPFSTVHPNNP